MNTHIMISQSMAADRVAPLAAQQPWRPNFPLSLSDLCPSLWFASSQVPAQLLLALNGLKQSLEIACVVRGMPRIRCAQVYAYMRTYVHVRCERACFFFSFSLSRSLALSLSFSLRPYQLRVASDAPVPGLQRHSLHRPPRLRPGLHGPDFSRPRARPRRRCR